MVLSTKLDEPIRRPKPLFCSLALAVLAVGCGNETGQTEPDDTGSATGPGSATEDPDTPTTTVASDSDNASTGDDSTTGDDVPGVLDPGRVTVHRLNRTEYNNTVRDLLGTSQTPADGFPADDFSLGFDNIADVLSTPPLLAELYERTADGLIAEAMTLPLDKAAIFRVEAEDATASTGGSAGNGTAWNIWSNGEIYKTLKLPADGKYRFSARMYGQQAGPDLPHADLNIDGATVGMFDVDAVQNAPEVYQIEITATAGEHKFAVEFTNDYNDKMLMQDRNLVVDWFEVEGPLDLVPGTNEQRDRIMICDPVVDGEESCARQILAAFAARAWRRPATDAEVTRLYKLITDTKLTEQDFETGLRVALQAVLVSPNFVFRVELDPDPTSLVPHPLSDHELASRLSYFLWSSMPDDTLTAAADQGLLQDPKQVEQQALRMLADPRAVALIDNFAGQWWAIRNIESSFKDPALYPQWVGPELKASMRTEMRMFAGSFFNSDRSMLEMLTSKQTFVDARLAEHYGIEGAFGPDFVEADFGDLPFQGILNKAGLMTVFSYGDRTSIVKRGRWVLDNLLCAPPGAPPDELPIPPLDEDASGTQREKLEQHRTDPACAYCHLTMDPPGFGLEHYDPLGAWRDVDEDGAEIDSTGTLLLTKKFADGLEMQNLIAADSSFGRCVVRKTFIYSLGRALDVNDIEYMDDIFAGFEGGEHRFADLVVGLVTSDVFRKRRGDPSM